MTTITALAPGCPVDASFDPLSAGFLADPFAVLAAGKPAVFFAPSIGYYVLTRYADIEEVFRDSETYSAAAAQAPLAPLVPQAGRPRIQHEAGQRHDPGHAGRGRRAA
jgi:cytochrome P450